MRILRGGIALALLAAASTMWSGSARADGTATQAAQQCPLYGGWVLYRLPVGGSGGIESAYFTTRGDCVNYFVLHSIYAFVATVYSNPHP